MKATMDKHASPLAVIYETSALTTNKCETFEYSALTDELWGVCCKIWWEIDHTTLYSFFED